MNFNKNIEIYIKQNISILADAPTLSHFLPESWKDANMRRCSTQKGHF
jgi:hypothetical protein